MQFPISDGAATAFTGEFYAALADGMPVDQAVTSARKGLLAGYASEWATPVLYLNAPDGQVFEGWLRGPRRRPAYRLRLGPHRLRLRRPPLLPPRRQHRPVGRVADASSGSPRLSPPCSSRSSCSR